jgi:hypothetical protein
MNEGLVELLVTLAANGELIHWLAAEDRSEPERLSALNCLACLHRDGRIDVLDNIRTAPKEDEWNIDFMSWSRIYRQLIPLIDDSADRVVCAVVSLASGFLAHAAQDAFLQWCAVDRTRIDAVLDLEAGAGIPDLCYAAALIAGLRHYPASYINIAVEYAAGLHHSRMPGILALGAMSVTDADAVRAAISALDAVVDDSDAPIENRVDALTAALEIAHRCDGQSDDAVCSLVSRVVSSGRTEFLTSCCHALVRYGSNLRIRIFPLLLEALTHSEIDASTKRTVDSALYHLLARGRRDEALDALETLLLKGTTVDTLNSLESTSHFLAGPGTALLPTVISRWLLTGAEPLCNAARHLLAAATDQKLVFDFDPGNKDWPDSRTLYLARKAVGWLMPHATAPASLVVCLMRQASQAAQVELAELLFDPLLINYPIAARAYLEDVLPTLPKDAKSFVQSVLARDDGYKQGVEAIGYVAELQPIERHRRIEQQRTNEEWSKARSEAELKSPLRQLFTRQTMLYGRRAIDYVDDPDGTTRRLDNALGTISYTANNAMGWVYDPFGLEFKLRTFRVEQYPA